ncbi:MAG: hypothetical protein F6K00_28915 [Leptolyngbya sp. SIOISBB]|nr:hypothetical protein [Leptolyngbya sp. SIOISBB]
MASYWPKGVDLKDISSPRTILESAQQEWVDHSDGLLTLIIQDTQSTDGDAMLVVYAKHMPSNRTVTLFSVVHRTDAPYPARIQPRNEELPNFLKKTYTRSDAADLDKVVRQMTANTIVNTWVCDTPSEFRSRLEDVFDLGTVKSEILNLIAVGNSVSAGYETEITESTSQAGEDKESNTE